jgi:hypothetical protein
MSSNTYIEPTAGTSLNAARSQQNDTFRALLTNFKSTSRPTGVNITSAGAPIGEQDGMLYRSATTNALYISDSVHKKSSRVGGNFTRVGIGNRVENGIVALAANAATYEIGELVATVSENGIIGANARLYLCVSNSVSAGSTEGFLDVGIPQGYTVGTLNNVAFSGQSVTAIRFLATSNVGIGTTSPTTALDVAGDVTITDKIIHAGDTNTAIRFPANDTVTVETNGSERVRVTSTGNLGIGTTSPTTALDVAGDVTITDKIIHAGDTNTAIRFPANDTVTIETNGSERVRVTSTGTVGIGTTSPSTALQVNGTVTATTFAGSAASLTSFPIATQAQAEAGTNNTQLMTPLLTKQAIDASGSVASLITSNTIASGTTERANVNFEVSRFNTGFTTHSFYGFIQKGTVNFTFDIRTDSGSATATGQIIRFRAGSQSTVLTQTTLSTSYVTFNSDQSVLPGDKFEFRVSGGGYTVGKDTIFTTGFMRNVKLRTSNVTYYVPSSGTGYTWYTLAQ